MNYWPMNSLSSGSRAPNTASGMYLKDLPAHEEETFLASRFELLSLSSDTVLLTYFLERENLKAKNKSRSWRSSIWQNRKGKWQMIFHQEQPYRVRY